ncbi:oxidoreductase [Staphylococcus muscae]|uniref:Quinone oxidoreductase n=1 Tax=Staphylococcus muscae TaxID=1294 RepID=A0A240C839_9STAP|nr:oxidoreductase [Staphylococcus muscae]AVQ33749.1 oxidoreductase [Staphylococcus muscae]PNZ02993.1 oxidoreductase [Staphylococcus muscae]GGA87426.1 quinone oxidoreductase [Staphylococcus muscae]SNW04157.1 zinc-binding alcohol dehydrogenase [Staphylococcus muscae]
MQSFKSYVLTTTEEGMTAGFKTLTFDDLSEGDVTIHIHYSSINYKDMLATQPGNKIIRQYPRIPGIDFSGIVIESSHPNFQTGDRVLATGYDIGVSHDGGFSEVARVKGDWLVPLPDNLTLEEAMIIGTAGYTAALSVSALEQNGLTPEKGPVLVRGASGGVGTMAIMMLHRLGYDIIASSSHTEQSEVFRTLGASQCIDRIDELTPKALHKTEWQGVIDPVGGPSLGEVLKRIHPSGAIALSGNAGGTAFESSVFPFILRDVRLIGIDSVYTPMSYRQSIWERLATDLKPDHLHTVKQVVPFDKLVDGIKSFNISSQPGRIVIDMGQEST